MELPDAVPEHVAIERLRTLAEQNASVTSLIGMGYVGTLTPPVIARNVLENPAWYTAYTPYQPEISQGRLEAILNFQTLVTELTGLDVANASLLDEATAAAEAMTMARRLSKSTSDRFFVHVDTHPQTLAVMRTRAEPIGIELVVGDVDLLEDDADGDVGRVLRCRVQPAHLDRCGRRLDRGHRAGPRRSAASPWWSPIRWRAC